MVLLEPMSLKLWQVARGDVVEMALPFLPQAMGAQLALMFGPLTSAGEFTRYLLRVALTSDERYLAYCSKLVGGDNQ